MPNPWDAGSAKLLADLGFQALATTSSGHAATLGRSDGSVARDEALAHAAAIVAAVDVPVSADLEDGFGPLAHLTGWRGPPSLVKRCGPERGLTRSPPGSERGRTGLAPALR